MQPSGNITGRLGVIWVGTRERWSIRRDLPLVHCYWSKSQKRNHCSLAAELHIIHSELPLSPMLYARTPPTFIYVGYYIEYCLILSLGCFSRTQQDWDAVSHYPPTTNAHNTKVTLICFIFRYQKWDPIVLFKSISWKSWSLLARLFSPKWNPRYYLISTIEMIPFPCHKNK